jgi:DNA (cytosine-5)-methyltransferase 1
VNPHAWTLADLDVVPRNGVTVMSTFACGGGSSMGYKRAGCDVVAANDIDPEMAWHYKRNLNPRHYFLCPIRDLLAADLPDELFRLDILDGSPPCSTFSMAGSREKAWGKDRHFREGQASQVLSDLFFDYLDLVGRLKPKVSVAENVKGMISGNAKGYVKMVMARFRELGYRPQLFLLNAADCGVPQCRERVFFVAVRNDIPKPPLKLAPAHRWVPAGEATSDVQSLTTAERKDVFAVSDIYKKYWQMTVPGKVSTNGSGKYGIFYGVRLSETVPSRSLSASGVEKFMHWSKCRQLTYREWKRLGSFPDDYHAKSDKIGKYMIGMSVPPRMAEAVARAVCEQWLNVPAPNLRLALEETAARANLEDAG